MTTQQIAEPQQLLKIDNPETTAALMQQLQLVQSQARDYIVPQAKMNFDFVVDYKDPPGDNTKFFESRLTLQIPESPWPVSYRIRPIAHEQLATLTGIGLHYYRKLHAGEHEKHDRLKLLFQNVNYWLHEAEGAEVEKLWTVRTVDDEVRAILSNGYFILDSWELLLHATRVAAEAGAVVQSIRLSEEKLYIRILHPDWAIRADRQAQTVTDAGLKGLFGGITDRQGHVAHDVDQLRIVDTSKVDKTSNLYQEFAKIATTPDLMIPMVIISNSEVGRGGLSINSGIWQPYCTNTASFVHSFGRVHRGARQDEGLVSPETKKKRAEVVWSEVEDYIRNSFDSTRFVGYVAQYIGLEQMELKEPMTVVEDLSAKIQQTFTDQEKQTLMNLLIAGPYGATAFAVVNAVTQMAHEQPDEDRRFELERLGGDLIQSFPRDLVRVRR